MASAAKAPPWRISSSKLPALDDAAVVEHQDAGGVAHGRKPVRDHEGGAVLHHLVERGLHLHLGGGVERAGRLVEDQDRRVLHQRARDRDALALAAREHAAALADAGLEAFRIALDEIERLRARGGLANLLVGRLRPADAQVLADRAVEQQHLLEHHADVPAQRRELASPRMSMPSILIEPDCGSNTRCSSASAVDLPAPVGPTSAMISPGSAVNFRSATAARLPS